MKNIPKERIERFVTMMAFRDEVYPDSRPWAQAQWAAIRKKHEMDCLKYGECEMCGTEDLLGEYLLTWICEDPACLKKVKKGYDEILADWHKKKH